MSRKGIIPYHIFRPRREWWHGSGERNYWHRGKERLLGDMEDLRAEEDDHFDGCAGCGTPYAMMRPFLHENVAKKLPAVSGWRRPGDAYHLARKKTSDADLFIWRCGICGYTNQRSRATKKWMELDNTVRL
jgi:hypothetical protein